MTKQKRESPAAIAKRRRLAYIESPETQRIHIPSVGFIDYTANFKYLGSLTSFDLREDDDIQARITKASQQMGALKNVWDSQHIELKSKYLFFLAIPISTIVHPLKLKGPLLFMISISPIISNQVALLRKREETNAHPHQLVKLSKRCKYINCLLECLGRMIPCFHRPNTSRVIKLWHQLCKVPRSNPLPVVRLAETVCE